MKLKFDLYSHLILLAFLLITLLLFPFFTDWGFSTELFKFLLTAILISAAYTLSHHRFNLIITGVLGFFAIVTSWLDEVLGTSNALLYANLFVTIAFFIYVLFVHIRQLIARKKVDRNLLYAALCGYILIGMLWGFIYALLSLLLKNAFHISYTSPEQLAIYQTTHHIPYFIYYSFVTLTTLGYGDIVPISPVAQSFASLEAIAGQFYLTVLVARLVALFVSQK